MIKKRRKEIYQPPYAQDLSGFSANGQVQPMGRCVDGNSPILFTCEAGISPSQNPSACAPTGSLPELGRCNTGGDAAEGCIVGSSVQDCVEGGAFS